MTDGSDIESRQKQQPVIRTKYRSEKTQQRNALLAQNTALAKKLEKKVVREKVNEAKRYYPDPRGTRTSMRKSVREEPSDRSRLTKYKLPKIDDLFEGYDIPERKSLYN